jgi:cephalosporin hydroxylase
MNPKNLLVKFYKRDLVPTVRSLFSRDKRSHAERVRYLFHRELIAKTNNFGSVKWLGYPIWQNVMDLWTIQETISEVKPELLIETGTNRGGSSLFYAQLFDLMGRGSVITIDVEKLHNLTHPRVSCLIGSSISDEIVRQVQKRVDAVKGPVMVILDSDHSEQHVRRELECYGPMVTAGSYCLVQDGVVDTQPVFRRSRPGPLPAIESFLRTTSLFELDEERTDRFLITHHPKGWLKRKARSGQ